MDSMVVVLISSPAPRHHVRERITDGMYFLFYPCMVSVRLSHRMILFHHPFHLSTTTRTFCAGKREGWRDLRYLQGKEGNINNLPPTLTELFTDYCHYPTPRFPTAKV